MKTIRTYLIAALVVGVLLGAKAWWFPSEKSKEKGNKEVKKNATPVSVFVAGSAEVEDKLFASGTLLATEEAELKSEASGRVVLLNLPEGKTVKAGTLLLKVNDADLQAQLNKTKVQIHLAQETEQRVRRLLQIEGSSRQELDNAVAALNALKADSAYLKAQIAKTEIRAPFDGVIGIRSVSVGSYITPLLSVAKIQQIHPIKIDFSLPEKYTSLLKVGDEIRFKTETNAQGFVGKIAVKDPEVDLATRSVRYRALSPNPKEILVPGAYVRVEIPLKKSEGQLFIPTEAVVPFLKGKKVFVVKDGLADEKVVETGLRTEEHIQILSGLEKGDSVVVSGNFQLKKGAAVKVKGNSK